MRRRGATVLLGAALLFLLVWQANSLQVPYVQVGPGPTVDTLGVSDNKPVITVKGVPATKSAGQLRLVTVGITKDLTLFDALRGWLQDDYAVVPSEFYYPPGKTDAEVDQEHTEEFKESQTSAETAALRSLGYPVQVTVTEVAAGTPAAAGLTAGDIITSVDGAPVSSLSTLNRLIRDKGVGAPRRLGITRAGAALTVTFTPGKAIDGAANKVLEGATLESRQPHPFEITIDLDRIGGPSAGMMFALGIIDTVDPVDLTGGLIIVGTGEIDEDGNVGRIGGIPHKLVAARQAGAKVFFTPADNCAEALQHAQPGLPLVKVSTLDDALNALRALREHRQPTLCTA